jgi:predicted nucleotidyltransferase
MSVQDEFVVLLETVLAASREVYGDRLVTLAVFGSVGRGAPRHDSDIDLLLVADRLPDGRIPRVREFDEVERRIGPALAAARSRGIATRLAPLFKTPDEVRRGSPLFLDMIDDARLLFDREGFFRAELARLSERLSSLGARRVFRGSSWYWDLKPDFRPGDVVEI